jgi:MFS family permease
MTATSLPAGRILTRRTVRFLLAAVTANSGFYLLLTAVPMYAVANGPAGAGTTGAGLATATLMLATVAAELAAPRLIARFGRRRALGASLFLLGLPALVLTLTAHPAAVLGVCALRGLGFGVAVVIGSAWMADLVPIHRRGEGLGLYGAVVGVPAIVALPLGVWLVDHVGFRPVFVAAAVVALAGLLPLAGLPAGYPAPDPTGSGGRPFGVLSGLRRGPLVRPAMVFASTATAAGIVVTFLPLTVSGGAATLVAPALLIQSTTATVGRWWAGGHGDRHGSGQLLVTGALLAAAGVLAFSLTHSAIALLGGAATFGLGFGIAQNASISVMFREVDGAGYDTASAVWNIGYDAGMGLGAAGFGLVTAATGFPVGFALTAALIPLTLVLLRRPSGGVIVGK